MPCARVICPAYAPGDPSQRREVARTGEQRSEREVAPLRTDPLYGAGRTERRCACGALAGAVRRGRGSCAKCRARARWQKHQRRPEDRGDL